MVMDRTRLEKKYYKKLDNNMTKAKQINSIKTLIRKGMTRKAFSEVEKYLEKYANDSYGLYQRATINQLLGNLDDAKEDLEYIIENNLESVHSATYKLANIILIEGDIKKAEELLINNIETSPYPETYSVIGLSNIKLMQGMKDEALEVIYKYGDLNDDEMAIQEAVIQGKAGEVELAYNLLINHKFSDNKNVLCKYYNTRAVLASVLGNYDDAKACYEKCFEYMSYHQKNRIEIDYATGCYNWGDYDKAREMAMKILYNGDSEYKERACFLLGNISKNLGNLEEAKDYYLESINYQDFPIYRGYACMAEVYTQEENYNKAKEYYNKIINNSKNEQIISSSYLRLAFIAFRNNNIKEVSKLIRKMKRKYLSHVEESDYAFLKILLDYTMGTNNIEEGYTYSQIKNYDYTYQRLLNHIDKVHEREGGTAKFSPSIDLSSFILEVKDIIKNSKPFNNYTMDIYRIKYDNIGYSKNEILNFCEVVVIPNTDKIITIYPCRETIITTEKKSEKSPQKKKNRIDIFNEKYGIK